MSVAHAVKEKSVREPGITTHVSNYFEVPGQATSFAAACFKGDDLSLSPLQGPGDITENYELALKVGTALHSLGAKDVYAPRASTSNAKIIHTGRLNKIMALPGGPTLRRNYDQPADGILLTKPRDGVVLSAGGCGVTTMTYRHHCATAHTSRESAVDREWVETFGQQKSKGRTHVSVVEAMLDALEVPVLYRNQVHVWPLYFIRPENFLHEKDHPKHGEYNYAAMRWLPKKYGELAGEVTDKHIAIDLPGIVRAQCLARGIPAENIHCEHQYLPDDLPTTRNGDGRYLVAVVRNS